MQQSILAIAAFWLFSEVRRTGKPWLFYVAETGCYNARCIPPFGIIMNQKFKGNQKLMDHEMVHWSQFQRMGLARFYIQYAKELRAYGYDGMPMEIEARYHENDYCKANYTYCVRNGLAETVYNPNFQNCSDEISGYRRGSTIRVLNL